MLRGLGLGGLELLLIANSFVVGQGPKHLNLVSSALLTDRFRGYGFWL